MILLVKRHGFTAAFVAVALLLCTAVIVVGQSQSGSFVTIENIRTVSTDASSVYVGSRGSGIIRFDSNSGTTDFLNNGISDYFLPTGADFRAVEPGGGNDGAIFCASEKSMILKYNTTTDRWENTGPILGSHSFYDIAVNPADGAHIYAGSNRGLLESLDGGATWSVTTPRIWDSCFDIAFDSSNPDNIYVASTYFNMKEKGRLYHSHDGGQSWTYTEMICPIDTVTVDPYNGSVIYALNSSRGKNRGNCPLISTDYGSSFTYFTPDIAGRFVYDVALQSQNALYAATDQGIYSFLTSGSENWTALDATEDSVKFVTFNHNRLYYTTSTGLFWYSFL